MEVKKKVCSICIYKYLHISFQKAAANENTAAFSNISSCKTKKFEKFLARSSDYTVTKEIAMYHYIRNKN